MMKRVIRLGLSFCLACGPAAFAQVDTLPDGLGPQIRTAEGLRALIARQDPRFVIVDVRSPAEYAAGHIPTAINIPGGITAGLASPPPKDRYLVVSCLGGRKSPGAAEQMRADGYRHVFVWGGIVDWPYPRASQDAKSTVTK